MKARVNEVLEALNAEAYDQVIDLHNNLRSGQVIRALKKPSSRFPKLNVEKWLMVNASINRMPDLHIVDRYFEAAKKLLKVNNDGKGLDFFIDKKNVVNLSESFPNKKSDERYLAIVLGATYYTKRIPVHKCEELITGLNYPIILIGGPEEKEEGEKISEKFDHVYNACGKFNLLQSASIIDQSELVISSDTGMMHIAAALKKRVIVLWGNTLPQFGMGPYKTESFSYEVKDLRCRPCSKLGHHKCPKGHFKCMENQDIEGVIERANTLLN